MEDFLQTQPLLVVPLGIVIWCAAMWLAAQTSGWSVLGEHYAANDAYDGERRRFQSIQMRRWSVFPSNYGGVVEFGADGRGLHIAIFAPFRPYHAPLLIPWSDLSADSKPGLFGAMTTIAAARAPKIQMTFPSRTAAWIAERSGGLF